LEEVFKVCKGKARVNVELKDKNKRLVEPVIKLIKEVGMEDWMVFSSFEHHLKPEVDRVWKEYKFSRPYEFGYLVW
jgi:hypothetical protein